MTCDLCDSDQRIDWQLLPAADHGAAGGRGDKKSEHSFRINLRITGSTTRGSIVIENELKQLSALES